MDYKQQAERLANTYADAILRLSYAYLKNTQDAQDVCQTVFVRLLTEPREFESGEHERAYILRMAANACKDLLKSPWRRRLAQACPFLSRKAAWWWMSAVERRKSQSCRWAVWSSASRFPSAA